MKKILATLILSVVSFSSLAEMPYINNNTADSRERIQKGDIVCETSKAQATINAGVYGGKESNYYYNQDDKGGYVGISIPIGGGDSKVDCSRLYDQVLRENDMRIKQLEAQLELMKRRTLTVGENK